MARHWARKTDDNHQEIMDAFRAHGFSVADTSRLGNGFPDLVVGKWGWNYLIEVKDGKRPPSERRLNQAELRFHNGWEGEVLVVKDISDIKCLAIQINEQDFPFSPIITEAEKEQLKDKIKGLNNESQ